MKKTTDLIQFIGIVFILFFRFNGAAQTVQYATAIDAIDFPLQTNEVISLVGYDWVYKPQIIGFLQNGNTINLTPTSTVNGTGYTYSSQIPQTATGLTNILVQNGENGISENVVSFATLKITKPACANVVSNYVPADAVVIPASATGNVQIILESSPDLVNWTAANPGIYGPSVATNRFFRVRAVAE